MPFDGVEVVHHDKLRQLDAVIGLLATPERWCKGALKSHDGRHCIRGAMLAMGADSLEPAILRAIGDVAGPRFRRIESFNDHPQTGHEQVLAALQRARIHVAAGTGGGESRHRAQTPLLVEWRGALRRWIHG